MSFSPDGKYLASQGVDGVTRIFNVNNKQPVSWENSPSNVRIDFSADSKYIVTGDNNGNIKIWELGDEINEFKSFNTGLSRIKKVIFNSDENKQYLAGYDYGGKAKLWEFNDINKDNIIQSINWESELEEVSSISFSPKGYSYGQLIATGEEKGKVRIWDMKGREIAEFQVKGNKVIKLKFSPLRNNLRDNYIIAEDENGKIYYWKISGLNDLINKGCNWLENYFSYHDNERNKLDCK